jgi:glutamate/tyrosine decarboxylase-like PLP-dependent enzyme
VRAFEGPVRFYSSRDCHIAWLKIAHQAGVGRGSLHLVDTDGCGRMDPQALARAIAEDRAAGAVPVMVVATAGTTGGGMIDPLHACADIAKQQRLWYHIDAAWGGAALASERMRGLLCGIERADSITIDAHKWFATTMGCAMFITPHAQYLSEAFHASTSFMPSSVAGVDPYLNSVQWSRRFVGLRLFLALGAAGWAGIGAHVERSVAVVERIRRELVALGWSVANDSALAVLDVVPPGNQDVRALVRRVVASGRAWVAPTTFEGRDVVRICATSGEVAEEDVTKLVAALNEPLPVV